MADIVDENFKEEIVKEDNKIVNENIDTSIIDKSPEKLSEIALSHNYSNPASKESSPFKTTGPSICTENIQQFYPGRVVIQRSFDDGSIASVHNNVFSSKQALLESVSALVDSPPINLDSATETAQKTSEQAINNLEIPCDNVNKIDETTKIVAISALTTTDTSYVHIPDNKECNNENKKLDNSFVEINENTLSNIIDSKNVGTKSNIINQSYTTTKTKDSNDDISDKNDSICNAKNDIEATTGTNDQTIITDIVCNMEKEVSSKGDANDAFENSLSKKENISFDNSQEENKGFTESLNNNNIETVQTIESDTKINKIDQENVTQSKLEETNLAETSEVSEIQNGVVTQQNNVAQENIAQQDQQQSQTQISSNHQEQNVVVQKEEIPSQSKSSTEQQKSSVEQKQEASLEQKKNHLSEKSSNNQNGEKIDQREKKVSIQEAEVKQDNLEVEAKVLSEGKVKIVSPNKILKSNEVQNGGNEVSENHSSKKEKFHSTPKNSPKQSPQFTTKESTGQAPNHSPQNTSKQTPPLSSPQQPLTTTLVNNKNTNNKTNDTSDGERTANKIDTNDTHSSAQIGKKQIEDTSNMPIFPDKQEIDAIFKKIANNKESNEYGNMMLKNLLQLIQSQNKSINNYGVVSIVLDLLVEGPPPYHTDNNYILQDNTDLPLFFSLIRRCVPAVQGEIWTHMSGMVRKSTRNLELCCRNGMLDEVLEKLKVEKDENLADILIDLLSVLCNFNIKVSELNKLFSMLKAKNDKWPLHSTKLLRVLQEMPNRQELDEFFIFPGRKESAIAIPPINKWPYQNGWTFHSWIRIDPNPGDNAERIKPFLFCFRTSKGVGYSGHFLGTSLVITSMKIKGKGFQHCVKFDFHPREWYMVTIVFVYNRWSKSELLCYVNGILASKTEMTWLVNTSDPYDKCYIGCTHDMDPDTMFAGQLSSIYLFAEALSPNQVAALEYLGAGYKGQFKFENESGLVLTDPVKKVLYDGRMTQSIVFLYTPVSCDSQLCLESSPKGNNSYFTHSPHALMHNQVKAVITRSVQATLHSIGGVQVLYPLFSQLDMEQEEKVLSKIPNGANNDEDDDGEAALTINKNVDYSICACLVGIVCDLVRSSPGMQQQFLQTKGFLVISYLLEKSTRHHLSMEVLDCFLQLTHDLLLPQASTPLLRHILDHILFNPALWIFSSMPVQKKLYSYISGQFVSDNQAYNHIRRVSSVLQTMHTLIYYYWVVNPLDRSGITPKGVDGPRPNKDNILELRSHLLQYVKMLVVRGAGVQDDELQSMINYLATVNEDDNIVDVLDLVVHLMADHPASMVPAFDRKAGIKVVFKLLASPNEMIRIQALKLLGFFLMRSTYKRKHEAMTPHNLFSLLTERLSLHFNHITLGTYIVLFEIMTERMTCEISLGRHEEPDNTYKLENPLILKVIASLIRQSQGNKDKVMVVKKLFLSDLTKLCSYSKENRRIVLQMSVWQDWLFSMSYIYPRDDDEQSTTETVMELFRSLLHHAVKFEFGGWRVWIDTLAILHSKVSNEDFKIHMAHVYQQYDRLQVSHVADPQARKQQPISTISGVDEMTEKMKEEKSNEALAIDNGEEDEDDDDEEENDSNDNEDKKAHPQESIFTPSSPTAYDPERPPSQSNAPSESPVRQLFSPGPRAPPFRIPEFRWSYLHQKLLSDLLFSLEQDVHAWKTHSSKTVIDYVNAPENHVFLVNVIHMISQLADILVTSCGGLLPLLAAATSPKGEIEMLEPNQGLSIEQAVSFLQRLINMTDILVFASSLNFAELEQEKSMSSGGILRQCLRLVCTAAVRNCLECRYRQQHGSGDDDDASADGAKCKSSERPDPIQALIAGAHSNNHNKSNTGKTLVLLNPVRDVEKLLQDMDINRLRAVVYRDVEETKQAQFLSLAIVYFVSVLMVSKYRDILEPNMSDHKKRPSTSSSSGSYAQRLSAGRANKPYKKTHRMSHQSMHGPQAQHLLSSNPSLQLHKHLQHNDYPSLKYCPGDSRRKPFLSEEEEEEGVADEYNSGGTDRGNNDYYDASLLSRIYLSGWGVEDEGSKAEDGKFLADENQSTMNHEMEGNEDKNHINENNIAEHKTETTSEDTSKDKTDKTNGRDDEPVQMNGGGGEESSKQDDKEAVPDDIPKEGASCINGVPNGNGEKEDEKESAPAVVECSDSASYPLGDHYAPSNTGEISAISLHPSRHNDEKLPGVSREEAGEGLDRIPATVQVSGAQLMSSEASSLTERLEKALGSVAPLLREIFVDFASFLSKTLLGSHGQELLIGGLVTLKQSSSVVELVMLLCSQEWQNSLQKHAGLAFIELVNEGRLLAHATRDHIVRVANEADFILNRMRADDVQKHADFETLCAGSMVERKAEERMCNHLITSARRRDHVLAVKQNDRVINLLSNRHGAWGGVERCSELPQTFWRLDSWEDDSRRRRRFVRNPFGSRHTEEALKAAIENGASEEAVNAAREAFRLHQATLKRGKSNAMQDTAEEDLSQLDERDLDIEFTGPVAFSTSCKLISPGCVVVGVLSITKNELYFEMDEEDTKNKQIDPRVLQYVDYLHGKWSFSEIRAIFSRRYLLQNVAVEIFMASRTAVMFAFQDLQTVRKVVNALPRVGIGVKYGLPQTRRVSMAAPKQIFKMSNMTQKWQRREISNFDYLMYLNTVAGRSYCDLNQYPVYPWVIVNYESTELDLNNVANYRDLSKPIGALNPTRRSFFEERYNSWDQSEVPPFHYGTHYSTSAFVLNWMIRVEPFTTFFLNLQGGKFDHVDRTFNAVLQAWKNCQRDTSDVKELIPEFYYLSDMFVNTNHCTLGRSEDGASINNVKLPPWAKSPEDFVRVMRMALESEIVSIQLHQWIDLIFGYKQRGPEAVRSCNMFYYLTYEGSINLDNISDPVLKEAIGNQIQSFGQTPCQLLTEPHPPRSSPMNLTPMMFTTIPEDVCMIMKFLSNSPVTHVSCNTHPVVPTPAVITVTCNYVFAVNKWNQAAAGVQQTPSLGYTDKTEQQTQLPLSMDPLLVAGSTYSNKRNISDNFDQRLKVGHQNFVTTADNKFIVAVGYWDKSFRVFSTDNSKISQILYGHFDVVTCVSRSECSISQDCYIVTGSKDCSVMVWHWVAKQQCILGDNGNAENATPKAVLTGHKSAVTCVIVSAELGIVVSASKDGAVLMHTNTGDLLRSLDIPQDHLNSPLNSLEGFTSPKLLGLNKEGYVLVCYEGGGLCSFSINGKLQKAMHHQEDIQCMVMNRDGGCVMVGTSSGSVEVRRSHDLHLLYSYPLSDSAVKSLALVHDQKFLLAGLSTGCLIVFNVDFNRWNPEFQDKYQ